MSEPISASPTAPASSGEPPAHAGFTPLERNILEAKGLPPATLKLLVSKGVRSREDFRTVGDAQTLVELLDMPLEVAQRLMAWALQMRSGAMATAPGDDRPPVPVVVEGADIVRCVHCQARQPKDYRVGDLCPSCGRQAEPVLACYWCGSSGPGRYCRNCAAEFVPTGEFELAVLLKRDGLPKDEIPRRLKAMDPAEKEALWGRARRGR